MGADPISLAKWSQREISSLLGSIARYTRFVFFSKFFLLIIGIVLLGLVVALPMFNADNDNLRLVMVPAKKMTDTIQPKMSNPRFQGVDNGNQPYTITADSAVQLEGKKVQLANLMADIMLKNKDWVEISADEGILDLPNKKLSLKGKVHLQQDKGYEFNTEIANIDLAKKLATGDQPITGQGSMGILRAKGFELRSDSSHILFTGPVALTLYPKGKSHK